MVDKYRYWKHEAIVADLDSKRHNFHIAIENWQHDLNIGTVVRTANAFLAKEVHIIGRRRWNRRGAMVTDRYQHVRHHPTVEDFVAWAQGEGLAIIGIDIFPDSVPLETYELPKDCVLVFGQEGPGLTPKSTKRRWPPCRSSSSAPPAPSTPPPPPRSRCTPGSAATCSASSRAKATRGAAGAPPAPGAIGRGHATRPCSTDRRMTSQDPRGTGRIFTSGHLGPETIPLEPQDEAASSAGG